MKFHIFLHSFTRTKHVHFLGGSRWWFQWENARGPGSLGDPARGIPTLLDPTQAEEHHKPGPLPLQAWTPPLPAGTPHPAPLWEKGQGVPAREGVPASGILEL